MRGRKRSRLVSIPPPPQPQAVGLQTQEEQEPECILGGVLHAGPPTSHASMPGSITAEGVWDSPLSSQQPRVMEPQLFPTLKEG